MVRDLVIDVDDPRRGDIRGLLETHLMFSCGETPIGLNQPFGGYPPSSENYFTTLELGE